METSSADLADTAAEFDLARQRTDAPLGLQMFLRVLKEQERVDEVLDWILDGRTPLVATCVGDPRRSPPGPTMPASSTTTRSAASTTRCGPSTAGSTG